MSKKQFGYIGSSPTQSFANLPSKRNLSQYIIDIDYLVVAGGGSGGEVSIDIN